MKHLVAELDGALLDAAVAKALGLQFRMNGNCFANPDADPEEPQDLMSSFEPSSYWEHGGPILDRARIGVLWQSTDASRRLAVLTGQAEQCWGAVIADTQARPLAGPSALVAAMRAFVVLKLGDEVGVAMSQSPEFWLECARLGAVVVAFKAYSKYGVDGNLHEEDFVGVRFGCVDGDNEGVPLALFKESKNARRS